MVKGMKVEQVVASVAKALQEGRDPVPSLRVLAGDVQERLFYKGEVGRLLYPLMKELTDIVGEYVSELFPWVQVPLSEQEHDYRMQREDWCKGLDWQEDLWDLEMPASIDAFARYVASCDTREEAEDPENWAQHLACLNCSTLSDRMHERFFEWCDRKGLADCYEDNICFIRELRAELGGLAYEILDRFIDNREWDEDELADDEY